MYCHIEKRLFCILERDGLLGVKSNSDIRIERNRIVFGILKIADRD